MPLAAFKALRQQGAASVLLLLFVLFNGGLYWHALGDDLASSFVGCRVLASGHGASLYTYDPVNFAGISEADSTWPALATSGGYGGWLHPYVQTPLWAWALQPLCTHMQWPAFEHLFLWLALFSMAGSLFLVARYWTPSLCHPVPLAIVLVALSCSEPFLFAMHLVQTHALLLLLTVAGLVLAQQNRPLAAGLCVACAAAIKITPGLILIYWLVSRRWRAAASFLLWSALLLACTRLVAGPLLFHDFLANMHRVSGVLLVSENNQSLAAWYMGRFFAPDEVFDVNAFALPATLRLLSTALMVLCAALGGFLDRPSAQPALQAKNKHHRVPFGAGIVLVAMTVFAPIAWTHYFIVLTIPLMMLAETVRHQPRSAATWLLLGTMLAMAAPLYRPFAPDVIHMDLADSAWLRGTFYAGITSLLALAALGGHAELSSKKPLSTTL